MEQPLPLIGTDALQMVQREDVDFDPKHIDENFMSDEKNYPVTGEEDGLKVRAGGMHPSQSTATVVP